MTATKTMSMREAAHKLLDEEGGPLKVNTITKRAMDKGLIKTEGKTPEATMGAVLGTNAKRDDAEFVRTRPGTYGLKGRDRKGQKAKSD